MEEDLGIDPESNQFQLAVSILFVTYVVSQRLNGILLAHAKLPVDLRNAQ